MNQETTVRLNMHLVVSRDGDRYTTDLVDARINEMLAELSKDAHVDLVRWEYER